jgi:hypothetical protein
MDFHNQVPIFILHVLEANVSEDARIVDENIYAPERLDGSLDNCVAVLDTVVVGNGLAASLLDLVDDHVGSLYDG